MSVVETYPNERVRDSCLVLGLGDTKTERDLGKRGAHPHRRDAWESRHRSRGRARFSTHTSMGRSCSPPSGFASTFFIDGIDGLGHGFETTNRNEVAALIRVPVGTVVNFLQRALDVGDPAGVYVS